MSVGEIAAFVITRPLKKGLELQALLQKLGIQSFVAPAFEVRLREGKFLTQDESLLEKHGLRLIFPSINAVAGFFQGLKVADMVLPSSTECIAVGPATAQALSVAGVKHITCSQGTNSEALLELPGLQTAEVCAQDIVIISAPGGRSLIESTLKRRGFTVHNIHVYQRYPLPLPNEMFAVLCQQTSINCVFTSSMAMQVALKEWPQAISEKILKGHAVVISRRLEAQAIQFGMASVSVSSGPQNESILATIAQ